MRGLRIALVVVGLMVAGCEREDPKLEQASTAFYESADKCLVTVRDQGTKFHQTPSCTALEALSMNYVQAGGDRTGKTPTKYDLRYHQGLRAAWTALAFSESCGKTLPRIW